MVAQILAVTIFVAMFVLIGAKGLSSTYEQAQVDLDLCL